MLSIHEYKFKHSQPFDESFFIEMSEAEAEAIQVKNAQWKNLKSNNATYYFDVEGDDCDGLLPFGAPACYKVSFYGDLRDIHNGVSIAFYRKNQVSDQDLGFGPKVFAGVQKGIYEFIKANAPYRLNWQPIYKGGSKINPEARKKVYELWSKRSLFPEKYVSMQMNQWIRRDIYDKYFVPEGFPALPATITSLREKSDTLDNLRNFYRQSPNAFSKLRTIDARMREAARAEELKKLKEKLESSEFNPNSIKENDFVVIKTLEQTSDEQKSRMISNIGSWIHVMNPHLPTNFSSIMYGQVLSFDEPASAIYFADEAGNKVPEAEMAKFIVVTVNFYTKFDMGNPIKIKLPINELEKISEDKLEKKKEEARNALNNITNDRTLNPKGFNVGDKILLAHENFAHIASDESTFPYGAVGVIQSISYNTQRFGREANLVAKIIWNEEESLSKNISHYRDEFNLQDERLHKFTEENKRKFIEAKELAEREKLIQSRRARLERAAVRDAERAEIARRASAPEIQELIDHPTNPNHVKPGDRIKILTEDEARQRGISFGYSIRNAGREAVVVSLRKYVLFNVTTPNELPFKVKVDYKIVRSTIESNIDANLVEKIVDERATRLQQRASVRAQARQAIIGGSATGGRQIGDLATVATGPNRGKRGHIIGWRTSGAYTYARIRTEATPSAPSEDIQVNVNLLEPVPGTPTSEQNNPYSFENFLLWRNGL